MERSGHICCGILIAATIGLMAWIFQIGVHKNLVRTINGNEWGRYMHAIAAALTKAKTGVGGFVSFQRRDRWREPSVSGYDDDHGQT
jgi:hypothetical protein